MRGIFVISLLCLLSLSIESKKYHLFGEDASSSSSATADQRLLVDVDIYNRPYTLPYILRQLEQLTCPCGQCFLDLRVYHVFDTDVEKETNRLVKGWVEAMTRSSQSTFAGISIQEWTAKSADDRANRLRDVMKRSVELQVNYLAMFDSMIILLEPEKLLSTLVSKDKPLMTPLLRSTKDMYTSTFFLNDQQSTGYYAYRQIYERKKLGCFLINGGIKDFYFFNFQYPQIRKVFLNYYDFDESQQQYGRSFAFSSLFTLFARFRNRRSRPQQFHSDVRLQSRSVRLYSRSIRRDTLR